MSASQLGEWKDRLERLVQSSRDGDAGGLFDDLYELAHTMGDAAAGALLDAYPELFSHKPMLTELFRQRVLQKEKGEAKKLLAQVREDSVLFTHVASKAVLRSYHRVGEMFDHLDFRKGDRFLMIGCGWVPETLFHVHDVTAVAEIIGLDVIPEAVETANALIKRLGYTRARAVLCDGASFDYKNVQIAFVTNMVLRKSAILSRIAETAPEDIQIAVREPYSLRRLWSESGEKLLDTRLEITGWGRSSWSLSRDMYLARLIHDCATERSADVA